MRTQSRSEVLFIGQLVQGLVYLKGHTHCALAVVGCGWQQLSVPLQSL